MKYFILVALSAFFLTNCSKQASIPAKPETKTIESKISVKKNDTVWESEGVYASYNMDDDMVHVMSGKDNESFIISFKKGSIPITGVMKDFSSGVTIAPFKASAAISDRYTLDTTKANKLKILIIDNPEKRIAGDFLLHLKRNNQNTGSEEINVFQGRFDVRFEPFSLK